MLSILRFGVKKCMFLACFDTFTHFSLSICIDDNFMIIISGDSTPFLLLLALGGDSWPSLFYSINHDFIVLYTKGIQKNLGDQFEFA